MLGLENTYRLKKDNTWEKQTDFKKYDPVTDKLFHHFYEAKKWLHINNPISVHGEIVDINKKMKDLLSDEYEFEIIVHRIRKPLHPIFTKEELKNVLLDGDDRQSNYLVVDYDGYLKLIPDFALQDFQEYPVRFELFVAGGGYVGPKSSLNHLDRTYHSLLEGWELHLQSGRSIYQEYATLKKSEEELKKGIMEIVNQLK